MGWSHPNTSRKLHPVLIANISASGKVWQIQRSITPLFEVRAAARELSAEAIATLAKLIRSKDERVALIATDKILERARGKPKEMADDDRSDLAKLTPQARKERILELLKIAASIPTRPTGDQEEGRDEVAPEARSSMARLLCGKQDEKTWLIPSLSPAGGEKMSKHSMRSGDLPAFLGRFAQLQRESHAPNHCDPGGRSRRLLDRSRIAEGRD
jgi:hypothetical protein